MNTKELKRFLDWRIKTRAVKTAQACEILGIRRPSLHAMRLRGDILGRQWDGEWWYPLDQVEKNLVEDGAPTGGRPRSGHAVSR